ncbi:hypothetical protein EGT74_08790 [Chitinophaga lutea]|uniref:Uncharacterized protein n=1 Tax=Chitinophaga lutea TaxID=2488634 RepID=A0A3N4QPK2_9BACT|nr:hypothetical protein [Chitinophaga lutea]RPE13594.1 hypothetical protein EGT74_08790 [Chitinophaga lutea]
MIKRLYLPPVLLPLLIVPILVWAFLFSDAFDIHLHDTYFVIGPYFLTGLLGAIVLFETAVYLVTRSFRQWRVLQYIHVYTLFFFILTCFFAFFFESKAGVHGGNQLPKRYFVDYSTWSDSAFWWGRIVLISFFAMTLGHVAFVTNVIAGFFRGKKAPL